MKHKLDVEQDNLRRRRRGSAADQESGPKFYELDSSDDFMVGGVSGRMADVNIPKVKMALGLDSGCGELARGRPSLLTPSSSDSRTEARVEPESPGSRVNYCRDSMDED